MQTESKQTSASVADVEKEINGAAKKGVSTRKQRRASRSTCGLASDDEEKTAAHPEQLNPEAVEQPVKDEVPAAESVEETKTEAAKSECNPMTEDLPSIQAIDPPVEAQDFEPVATEPVASESVAVEPSAAEPEPALQAPAEEPKVEQPASDAMEPAAEMQVAGQPEADPCEVLPTQSKSVSQTSSKKRAFNQITPGAEGDKEAPQSQTSSCKRRKIDDGSMQEVPLEKTEPKVTDEAAKEDEEEVEGQNQAKADDYAAELDVVEPEGFAAAVKPQIEALAAEPLASEAQPVQAPIEAVIQSALQEVSLDADARKLLGAEPAAAEQALPSADQQQEVAPAEVKVDDQVATEPCEKVEQPEAEAPAEAVAS